ncbi:MAG: hypothetical protein Q9219_005315 [cf. Caloplaca sp. 3 TL-2023]
MSTPTKARYTYSTVTGYFLQDSLTTIPTGGEGLDPIPPDFGLIQRTYVSAMLGDIEIKTQWQRFEQEVKCLNAHARDGACYKVLFLGRHGQGWHNVAEKRYGRKEWDDKYAALEGDSQHRWRDARLTVTGIRQATSAKISWCRQLIESQAPAPEKYYTSPLYRCLETANLTFLNLPAFPYSPDDPNPPVVPYAPVVKELLREANGVHTCDRRSPLSKLRADFPNMNFEEGFREEDELWDAKHRETNEELDARMRTLLDDIFGGDGRGSVYLSLTSHSGAIGGILRVLGHCEFRVATGGILPVLVKAERMEG